MHRQRRRRLQKAYCDVIYTTVWDSDAEVQCISRTEHDGLQRTRPLSVSAVGYCCGQCALVMRRKRATNIIPNPTATSRLHIMYGLLFRQLSATFRHAVKDKKDKDRDRQTHRQTCKIQYVYAHKIKIQRKTQTVSPLISRRQQVF